MSAPILSREELDRLTHAPARFDALLAEDGDGCLFEKTVRMDDPGVAEQRVTPAWPHHLPGELVIALTGGRVYAAPARPYRGRLAGTASASSMRAIRRRCSVSMGALRRRSRSPARAVGPRAVPLPHVEAGRRGRDVETFRASSTRSSSTR